MNPAIHVRRFMPLLAALFATLTWRSSAAPPRTGELEGYAADGTLAKRQAFARSIGNDKFDPELLARAKYNLQRMVLEEQGKRAELEQMAPPPAWRGMPTTGNVKVLCLLVEFNDYRFNPANTQAMINGALFGNGDAANAPYESLQKYYQRSSYNKLTLQGNTLGWYRTAYNRSAVTQNYIGRENLIKEVINHYNALGHDFSQYDNDGDGDVDLIYVIYAGPDTGWGNFWWAYQTSWQDQTYVTDGKRYGKYVFQFQNYNVADPFTPRVIIHETGHALGIPDFYDYDGDVGPDGGVGGLDIMDGNRGDHNCYSKWLLGWLTPTFIGSGSQNRQLRPSGTTEDCVMIWPGAAAAAQFSEMYMVQNRTKTGNDNASDWPGSGMMIWHIDGTLTGDGQSYGWDNSYTSHKLLRLMEADGLNQIENNQGGDAGDFYRMGKTFSPTSTPNSNRYNGASSQVEVTNFTPAQENMRAQFTIIGAGTRPTVSISGPGGGASFAQGATIPITATAADADGITSVAFFGDGMPISTDTTAPFEASWTGAAVGGHTLTAVATDGTGLTTTSAGVAVTVTAVSTPANDPFAGRFTISGNVATVAGTNVNCSAEAGEPNHANYTPAKSVWWTWTPSITGTATITTAGSNYDTVLAAYTGTALGSLVLRAGNDDVNGSADRTSSVIFAVTAGVPIQIAVDGYNGSSGTITLNVAAVFIPPTNDPFSGAITISNAATQNTVTGTNNGGTAQAGEPPHGGVGASFGPFASAWWKWTAPSTGTLAVSTAGSDFDTTLGVYTGGAVNALTLRASNDDTVGLTSFVSLPVTAGTTYYIAVDGFNGATGEITLQTTFDDFNDPPTITMISPANGQSIGLDSWMYMAAEAFDPEGRAKEVRFYLNGALVETVPSTPESVTFEAWRFMDMPGYYTVTATAEDTQGLTASATATVLVGDITLPEALDNFTHPWLSGGTQFWSGTAAASHDGSDSAVSGDIGDAQQSGFTTQVTGPGNIAFWWSVSSEEDYDYLTFFIDGVAQAGAISGNVPWTQASWNIPAGVHTLKWEYSKDSSLSHGSDSAWVDQVVWLTPPVIYGSSAVSAPAGLPFSYAVSSDVAVASYSVIAGTLPPGLTLNAGTGVISGIPNTAGSYPVTLQGTNAAGSGTLAVTFTITPTLPIPVSVESPLPWPTGGDTFWYGQAATTHDGVDAAQSGPMVDNQSTWMETYVSGPGTLTFWCRISSEANYDYLRFYIDSVEQSDTAPAISGEVDWVLRTVPVAAGNHVLRWTYSKDYSVGNGSDAAWVDQVVFGPAIPPAVDTPALTWATSGNANWFGQILTTHDGVDAAQSGDIGDFQSSTTETTVTGPGSLSFWWKVESEAGFDFLRFYLDDVEQVGAVAISGNVDWQQKTIAIPAGPHTLRWTYSKDGSVSTGADAAWLDQVVYSSFNFTAPGTTAGRSLWNRPDEGAPPTTLSGFATAVPYDVMCFTVSTTGSYTLKSTAGWDNYLHLYSADFNPATPLANVLVGNDDFEGEIGIASFTTTLTAGTRYYVVISGFQNVHSGTHTIDITGAGSAEVTLTVAGTTAGRPAWNRTEDNGSFRPSVLSAAATAVPHDVVCFTVSASGNYVLRSTGTNPAGWDNYLHLYSSDFNPLDPLAHGELANDDNPNVGVSAFTATLYAGTTYFAVTSGYTNGHSGAYSLDITGPGRPQSTTSLENWRLTWFGDKANAGAGADAYDYDLDGVTNFAEFAFGLNPTLADASLLPGWTNAGGIYTVTFPHPAGVTGITYRGEWSTTLQPGSWTSIPDSGVAPQHTFSITAGPRQRLYLRVTPSAP